MKVFLSHSSKQKSYVEQVACILKRENVIYDSWTFEEGNKTLEEIYKGIDRTGIFTFFISKDSLSSDWVRKELLYAEELVYQNKLRKFLPIIIDSSLNHKSPEIPEWMKAYNIKYIHKPGRAAVRIKNELLSIYAENMPNISKEEQLFIGRNDEKKSFEERYYSPTEEKPIVYVVNGLPKIGKRKFIKKVLRDLNIIDTYYRPEVLELDRRNSIEDLILKIYGLGFSKEDDVIENLISLSLDDKLEICVKLINELYNAGEMLIILDNQFIFSKNGDCAPWFIELVNKLEDFREGIKFCVASMARIKDTHKKFKNNSLFSQTITEFLTHERRAYFEQLLKINNIELSKKDEEDIIDSCSGIPAQIRFAANLLKSSDQYKISEHIQRIIDFNKSESSELIKEYDDNKLALQLLKFLSMGEFFSYSLIYDIFNGEKVEDIDDLLTSFNNNLIIEPVANGVEFIKLTDSVRDYIERRQYKLDEKYYNLIRSMAEKNLHAHELNDSSVIGFYMKEAIKLDINMPRKYLMPSFYLNAMRDLYNYDKRYSVVVKLAKKVLEYKKNIDSKIMKEILYWYCLSLARLRDPKLLNLVQEIDGVDHDFILGFYYRIIGNNDKSIERLKLVLEKDINHFRAKRELVQVYINTEQYEQAYTLAKQNYEAEPSNPYNIQSYFKCLIRRDDFSEKEEILQQLLDSLKNIKHEKSDEMFITSNAQFIAYIEKNYKKAIIEIDEAINIFPKNIYPYLVKLEIIRNNTSINYIELADTLSKINDQFDKDNDIFNKLIYVVCEILLRKNHLLDKLGAERYFNEKVIGKFPKKIIDNIRTLLD